MDVGFFTTLLSANNCPLKDTSIVLWAVLNHFMLLFRASLAEYTVAKSHNGINVTFIVIKVIMWTDLFPL